MPNDANYIAVYFNEDVDYSERFVNLGNIEKIIVGDKQVENIGEFSVPQDTRMEIYFTGTVESLSNFFNSYHDFNTEHMYSIDFSNFDGSNVKSMDYMFYACTSLKSVDLSNVDLTQITDMSNMFDRCEKLESLTFPTTGAQNLKKMDNILEGYKSLTSIDFSMFTISEGFSAQSFITECDSLIAINFPKINLGSFDFSEQLGFFRSFSLKYIDLTGITGENSQFANFLSEIMGNILTSFCCLFK